MDGQVGRLLALEYPADIAARQAIHVSQTAAVAHQSAGANKLTKFKHRRHRFAQCERGELGAATDKEWIAPDHEPADANESEFRESRFEVAFAASLQYMQLQPK